LEAESQGGRREEKEQATPARRKKSAKLIAKNGKPLEENTISVKT